MAKNQNDEILKYAKYAGFGLLAYTVLRPILASAKAVTEVAVSAAESKVIQQKTSLTNDEIILCKDVARKVDKAMYDKSSFFSGSWFGGSFEDEAAVIQNLNRLSSFEQAKYTSDEYFTVTQGKNLKQDVDTFLEQSDRDQIRNAVYSGLK